MNRKDQIKCLEKLKQNHEAKAEEAYRRFSIFPNKEDLEDYDFHSFIVSLLGSAITDLHTMDNLSNNIMSLLIEKGQNDTEKFAWGEIIRFTPSEVRDAINEFIN